MDPKQDKILPQDIEKIDNFIVKALESELVLKLIYKEFADKLALKLRNAELIAKNDFMRSAPTFPVQPTFYGRKVFVGGLPTGITTDELVSNFCRFGPCIVDWPNKALFEKMPPRGYAFLVFENSASVNEMMKMCAVVDQKLCIGIHLKDGTKKVIEVKPWDVRNNEVFLIRSWRNFSRNSVFIGGLPRTMTANELAMLLQDAIGNVAHVAIEIDEDTDYPKGAARVIFSTVEAYIKAIAMRELTVYSNGTGRIAEIKPFILTKMKCENCQLYGAPSFCPEIRCLKYYCDNCWQAKHSAPGMTHHTPMQKGRYFTTKGHHLGLDEKPIKRRYSQSGSGSGMENEAALDGMEKGDSVQDRKESTMDGTQETSPAFSGITENSKCFPPIPEFVDSNMALH